MRLSRSQLDALPPSIVRPAYDLDRARVGIVHLGIGAFHRAHQAVMIEDCLARGETGWAIAGASLRSPETRDALEPQDNLYTLSVRSAAGEALRIVGAIRESHVARQNASALLARMAAPDTKIVSLTVTEKGYCHDPATGQLNETHPDILHDIANPATPRSAIGYLARALRLRREAGLPPFTVLCCDNLPANGKTVKRVIDRFAALVDADFGQWVAGEVACPSSMVDRIVPATTDEDRARISGLLGLEDRWPVITEPFIQWVIEDHFPQGRPDLAASGAELARDVTPFEHMKLRLLNGSHSTIAYLGYLAGYETVSDTVADADFARLVRTMMDDEITPTLTMPASANLSGYKDALMARFANPALRHRTWQIAMDGSQKLPQRLLGTIRDRLAKDAPIDRLALGVAGWMRYVSGKDEEGAVIDVRDPMAEKLAAIATGAGPVAARLGPALMGIGEIFGSDLPADPRFTSPVLAALEALFAKGARKTVATLSH
ncbi:MAG TPA: mannitol dehydrogenase family protein [Rhabdaerophilum sp.]|nr:mannitol dehydrogenase family protein [Rhabdaerophilum sp.]